MDVIGAAKKISEAGANLDKFCRLIADQVLYLLLSALFGIVEFLSAYMLVKVGYLCLFAICLNVGHLQIDYPLPSSCKRSIASTEE